MNECLTLGRVCQGGMDCVNRVGGYTCVPSEVYQRPYRQSSPVLPETSYPELSDPVSDTFLPAPPRFVEPSYPRIRNPALCTLGYALAADGTCNGECLCSGLFFRLGGQIYPNNESKYIFGGQKSVKFRMIGILCQINTNLERIVCL